MKGSLREAIKKISSFSGQSTKVFTPHLTGLVVKKTTENLKIQTLKKKFLCIMYIQSLVLFLIIYIEIQLVRKGCFMTYF